MSNWVIKKYDGLSEAAIIGQLPGNIKEKEVHSILQRLVCRDLEESEVISASLRRNSIGRRALLDRVGNGTPITYGENPFYTAEFRD